MSIYSVAVVDGHGNVGHWFTGSDRENNQCDRDRCRECLHRVFFLVDWHATSKRSAAAEQLNVSCSASEYAKQGRIQYSGARKADDLSEFLQSGALPLGNVRSIR